MNTPGQPDSAPGHRLPGVRYRTETRQRSVIHAVNGDPEEIEQDYQVLIPVPPRDWDRIVMTAVTAVAAGLLAIAIVWSVASIGDLLARAVVAPIAYLAASAFALVWVSCMALEWLARYNADRAAGSRNAGNVALVLDMAAVATHGHLEDSLYVGLAGAAVSAVAKYMWSTVMKAQARPLPELTRRWLTKREANITARLALGAQLRTLARVEGQAAVYAPPAIPAGHRDTTADTPGHDARTVLSAVLAASATMPDATPADIVAQLAAARIITDTDTVQDILDADTDIRPDTTDSRSQPRVRTIAPAGQSIADTVRTALASGITDKSAVLSYVRKIHGQDVTADTVARTRRRVEPDAS
ncbi:hypothetical protein [Streptomyces sp. NBC_01508]|uniref:hypothetical protein n=1 Tax=Streptomyces sp. NBC_01508 TaxID=2903888 RepID=UPI003863549D